MHLKRNGMCINTCFVAVFFGIYPRQCHYVLNTVFWESCVVVLATPKKVNPVAFYRRSDTHNLCHLTVSIPNQFVPELVRHLPCLSGFVLHISLFIFTCNQFLILASLTNATSEFSLLWFFTRSWHKILFKPLTALKEKKNIETFFSGVLEWMIKAVTS